MSNVKFIQRSFSLIYDAPLHSSSFHDVLLHICSISVPEAIHAQIHPPPLFSALNRRFYRSVWSSMASCHADDLNQPPRNLARSRLTQISPETGFVLDSAPSVTLDEDPEGPRLRAALEVERNNRKINDEHGQSMEANILSMTQDINRLRFELANAEKRAIAAVAVANSVSGYGNMYVSSGMVYGGGSYPVQYPNHQGYGTHKSHHTLLRPRTGYFCTPREWSDIITRLTAEKRAAPENLVKL